MESLINSTTTAMVATLAVQSTTNQNSWLQRFRRLENRSDIMFASKDLF